MLSWELLYIVINYGTPEMPVGEDAGGGGGTLVLFLCAVPPKLLVAWPLVWLEAAKVVLEIG
jgi:hypothetical protein